MAEIAGYLGLSVSAFLSATLLPGSSEAALLGLLAAGTGNPAMLVVVATVGNVLGSVVNWAVGRSLAYFQDRRPSLIDPRSYDRAAAWYGRFGAWSLLLSWLPIVGDPLTVVAGALRVDIRKFLILVTLGKGARYLFIAAAFAGWNRS